MGLLETLWNILEKIGLNLGNLKFKKQESSYIIKLFTKIYKQRVEMLDDREFFNDSEIYKINYKETDLSSQNFPLEKVQKVASFLNIFAYRLIILENHSEFQQCKKPTIKLLKELFNRDQRKKYCPEHFWIIQEANDNYNNENYYQEYSDDNKFSQSVIGLMPHIYTFKNRHEKFVQLRQQDYVQQAFSRNPFQFYDDEDEDEDGNPIQNQNQNNNRVVTVKRGQEFETGFQRLINKNLKALYKIRYINEYGIAEPGIDGGGIQKEFFTSIINHAFNPQNGYFIETQEKTLMPNPENKDDVKYYFYIGKMVAKAIYEDILIEPVLSRLFLNQILSKKNNIEELQFLDQNLYKSLMQLKYMKEDISELEMTFTINEDVMNHETNELTTKKVDLKPNGDQILVTNENKLEYIMLYSDYKLNQQTYRQVNAFRDGFLQVINSDWLQMFNFEELQLLISGNFNYFSIEDLKQNTQYNGYNKNDNTIIQFWQIMEEFSQEEKQKLLYFVTSCSRPPTLGFSQLEPKFQIQISADDENFYNPQKLPTSSTCMNILKIPDYQNKQKLKEKLLLAINSKAGFDLT